MSTNIEAIRDKMTRFRQWQGNRTTWRVDEVPEDVRITNEELSTVILWDWNNRPKPDKYQAYVSGDGKALTLWTGEPIARVTVERKVSGGGFHYGSLYYYRAVAPDGSEWYGRGLGRGMSINLRRAK